LEGKRRMWKKKENEKKGAGEKKEKQNENYTHAHHTHTHIHFYNTHTHSALTSPGTFFLIIHTHFPHPYTAQQTQAQARPAFFRPWPRPFLCFISLPLLRNICPTSLFFPFLVYARISYIPPRKIYTHTNTHTRR
jgi:hypothetical protein